MERSESLKIQNGLIGILKKKYLICRVWCLNIILLWNLVQQTKVTENVQGYPQCMRLKGLPKTLRLKRLPKTLRLKGLPKTLRLKGLPKTFKTIFLFSVQGGLVPVENWKPPGHHRLTYWVELLHVYFITCIFFMFYVIFFPMPRYILKFVFDKTLELKVNNFLL